MSLLTETSPSIMLVRRSAIAGIAASFLAACTRNSSVATHDKADGGQIEQLEKLQASIPGILGAYIIDCESGQGFGINENKHFALCSSFKLSLAAMVLQKADRGEINLDQRVHYSEGDLLSYSPVTRENLAHGLTLEELAKAAQVASDNAAANILMREFGGPQAMTQFWRNMGDTVSRLDKTEPDLNLVAPGDEHDTTTPEAMAHTLAKLMTGTVISESSRAKLWAWMQETSTGLQRIRGGIPKGWPAGDKTGTSFAEGFGSNYADIAFVRPPNGPPLAITSYYRLPNVHKKSEPQSQAVLAKVGAIAADFARQQAHKAT
ncbi:class A beta-lactamase [Altererythrobacter indicus]|uniref:beta-lactamase n=1 Tax=Altericroceibacterium indicum TaxID=374177 RepID=A0A845AAE6_9SPHN|nr:class A beta-lactamase [Altericroceibacterium indicum]MXP25981.1 class A beta-lactamase [Altericroceibacterium indicum]